MEFEQKATILTDEVCLSGELNDDDCQERLIAKGCINLVEMVQNIK